jgi:hypothetical protein
MVSNSWTKAFQQCLCIENGAWPELTILGGYHARQDQAKETQSKVSYD